MKRALTCLHGTLAQGLVLLAILLAAACGGEKQDAAPASGSATPPPAAAGKLVVVTPHNEFIKNEFARAFGEWWSARHPGQTLKIEWQDRGGTVDVVKYIVSTFQSLGDRAAQGIGIDLAFGGGVPAFEQLKKGGCLAPVQVPAEILNAIPPRVSGVSLRDPENQWFGVVLSSFGIIYNKVALKAKGLPDPATWADLTDPAYRGGLVLADPAKSGSVRVCYEVILQKYGWEKGWAMMMRIAGNTREFTPSSSQVPNEVAQGSALAGMCIDFYGYNQIEQNGADVVGYVSPAGATAITPDPIAMLKGAPNAAAAAEFVEFVLSEKGQALWGLKPGTPDGPIQKGLWRSPVLPAIYEKHAAGMLMTFNPYAEGNGQFNVDDKVSTAREPLIGPLFTAAFLSNMEALKKAAAAVQDRPERPELAALFEQVPFTQAESLQLIQQYLGDTRRQIALDEEWHQLFADRYARVIRQAGQ